jgi:hypothetical protein
MVGDPVSCDTLAADSGVLTQFMDSPSDSAPTLSPSIVASPQTPPAPSISQQTTGPMGLRLELAPQINNLANVNNLNHNNANSRRSATVVSSR